jgi:hypothetical protein
MIVDLEAHRTMLIRNSQELVDGPRRNREAKIAAHELARKQARAALDELKSLTSERERREMTVGRSRADLAYLEKQQARCIAPEADAYPTDAELFAFSERRQQFDEAVHRLHARIGTEQRELGNAQARERDALEVFRVAQAAELAARDEVA